MCIYIRRPYVYIHIYIYTYIQAYVYIYAVVFYNEKNSFAYPARDLPKQAPRSACKKKGNRANTHVKWPQGKGYSANTHVKRKGNRAHTHVKRKGNRANTHVKKSGVSEKQMHVWNPNARS